MTVEVRWSDVCTADVRSLPWRTAAGLCAAVMAFARTGAIFVLRIYATR